MGDICSVDVVCGVFTHTHTAQQGNAAVALFLLQHGADPNSKSKYGTTALFAAARAGETALVKMLLEYGADRNVTNNAGRRAVQDAALRATREVSGVE